MFRILLFLTILVSFTNITFLLFYFYLDFSRKDYINEIRFMKLRDVRRDPGIHGATEPEIATTTTYIHYINVFISGF